MVAVGMAIELFPYQKEAIEKLKTGSILVGGVGSGKSLTSLAYYFVKECGGKIDAKCIGGLSPMTRPKDLYIITTARKRDTFEWEKECANFLLSKKQKEKPCEVSVVIDSWNNVAKYANIKNAFFIFDEQRVVGNGTWVKAFLKIAKNNNWILLSATPGDTWMDYIPVFLANGWYKNRTEFIQEHVVYNTFSKFPKVDHYVGIRKLISLREQVLVHMKYCKKTTSVDKDVVVGFDRELFDTVLIKRWNVYEKRPVRNISELCYLMRKVVNSDPRRVYALEMILEKHPKVIAFYNFDYERELLLELGEKLGVTTAQWNGHAHELLPTTEKWLYLVQYSAGAEGWNCIETNVIAFYSQNYSYKATVQAAGRIDRLNTPFDILFYYHLRSHSFIDLAIKKAYDNKRDFNEHRFMAA